MELVSPATLAEMARMAGASVATTSRDFTGGPGRPAPELLRGLSYLPNAAAQAAGRGHTNVVGLIVHDINDPYFSSIAAGVTGVADEQDMIVTLADTRRRPEREAKYLASLRQLRCRAVILAGSRSADQASEARLRREIASFTAGGGRVAMISQQLPGVDTVLVENSTGARDLAHSLFDLGHRSFVVLAGPASLRTSRDRVSGFRQGLADRGLRLEPRHVLHADFTREGGFAAAMHWRNSGVKATCLFAANDVMAVGAMAALRQLGLSVPEEISIAGFDDILPLRDISPAVTTVHIPLETLGMEAMGLVLAPECGLTPRVRRIRCTVRLRESTRHVP
ncbi:LacI family DNA-binding transcriptional regulator [Dactylosporangium darangshiense]|uniref:LacI family DNA-binding transcriptional regulator n=1 Tax=Dactylosporangium darangshiense TaxID=579108 RepID=A0ABP8DFJ4_9ACTN